MTAEIIQLVGKGQGKIDVTEGLLNAVLGDRSKTDHRCFCKISGSFAIFGRLHGNEPDQSSFVALDSDHRGHVLSTERGREEGSRGRLR